MVRAYFPITEEAEAEFYVQSQLGLYSKTKKVVCFKEMSVTGDVA